MEDMLKKLLNTWISGIANAADKLKEAVDELAANGKISEDEARNMVNRFVNETKEKKDDFEDQFKNFFDKILDKLDVAREAEVDELKRRVEALENRLNS